MQKKNLNSFELNSVILYMEYLESGKGFDEQIIHYLKEQGINVKDLESELKIIKKIYNEHNKLLEKGYTILTQYYKKLLIEVYYADLKKNKIEITNDDIETIVNAVITLRILENEPRDQPLYQGFEKIYSKVHGKLWKQDTLRKLGVSEEKIKKIFLVNDL